MIHQISLYTNTAKISSSSIVANSVTISLISPLLETIFTLFLSRFVALRNPGVFGNVIDQRERIYQALSDAGEFRVVRFGVGAWRQARGPQLY